MLYWINFLHIHQPPTQDPLILEKVALESYNLILKHLEKHERVKITLNISGDLSEKLKNSGNFNLVERIKQAILRGQIELTTTAMYHPILPLIPLSEVVHQIKLNDKVNKEIFGDFYKPTGFYLPEMAYNQEVAEIINNLGYQWIILDEVHYPLGKPRATVKYNIKGTNLKVLFRNRKFSKSFPPQYILENFDKIKEPYLITAHDGEMYGHWHKDQGNFLEQSASHSDIKQITVSEYLSRLTIEEIISPRSFNWETTKEEVEKNISYGLWDYPGNDIQMRLWKLAREVYSELSKNHSDSHYSWAKKHYDQGISSCYWWWASEKKVDVFSPVSWNPTIIEQGVMELLSSIRSYKKMELEKRLKFEKHFGRLRKDIWIRHWQRMAKK